MSKIIQLKDSSENVYPETYSVYIDRSNLLTRAGFAVNGNGNPYLRWNMFDGTMMQVLVGKGDGSIKIQYYDGTSWSTLKSYS